MSSPKRSRPLDGIFRWVGYCLGCHRAGLELETRYEHSAKALCDDCAARQRPHPQIKRRPTRCDGCGRWAVHGPDFDPSKAYDLALLCDRCSDAKGRS
jgi:hypothetical protein